MIRLVIKVTTFTPTDPYCSAVTEHFRTFDLVCPDDLRAILIPPAGQYSMGNPSYETAVVGAELIALATEPR